MSGSEVFRVGVDRDFLNKEGELKFEIGLELLDDAPNVEWEFLPEHGTDLTPADIAHVDGLLLLRSRITTDTLADAKRLVLVARCGTGYERVDVDACTSNGVLLAITPDAVRRPVATGALTLMLALSQNVLGKDRILREGRWDERHHDLGPGLAGKQLGIVGLGNIGREFVRLCEPFELDVVAADPAVDEALAAECGVDLVSLEELLSESDFVSIHVPVTDSTRQLINRERIELMKPTAYLINTARGEAIDQRALYEALRDRRIAGAGLDTFDPEPPDPEDPLFQLDNVVLAPHTISQTEDSSVLIGRSACRNLLAAAAGRVPEFVVNTDAVTRSDVVAKLGKFPRQPA